MHDVLATYEGTSMSQTKIWDIQVYVRPPTQRGNEMGGKARLEIVFKIVLIFSFAII